MEVVVVDVVVVVVVQVEVVVLLEVVVVSSSRRSRGISSSRSIRRSIKIYSNSSRIISKSLVVAVSSVVVLE